MEALQSSGKHSPCHVTPQIQQKTNNHMQKSNIVTGFSQKVESA